MPSPQLEILRGPSLEEFSAKVQSYQPTFIYLVGPYSGQLDSIKGTVGPITMQGACVRRTVTAGSTIARHSPSVEQSHKEEFWLTGKQKHSACCCCR